MNEKQSISITQESSVFSIELSDPPYAQIEDIDKEAAELDKATYIFPDLEGVALNCGYIKCAINMQSCWRTAERSIDDSYAQCVELVGEKTADFPDCCDTVAVVPGVEGFMLISVKGLFVYNAKGSELHQNNGFASWIQLKNHGTIELAGEFGVRICEEPSLAIDFRYFDGLPREFAEAWYLILSALRKEECVFPEASTKALNETVAAYVDKDYEKAYKLLAEVQYHPGKDFLLGKLYYLGQGVKQDSEAAIKFFRSGVLDGSTECMCALGHCYATHLKMGDALMWYERAAALGNHNGMYQCGLIYYRGQGVKQNYKRAWEYLQKSSKKGNPDAQCLIGRMYTMDWPDDYPLSKNIRKAENYYKLAVTQGNSQAMFFLGKLYYLGTDGIDQDKHEGERLIRKAADGGYILAKNFIKSNF